LPGGQVEQALQRGVHDGAADRDRAGALRDAVDDAEPVQQRALHEVRSAGGRQRGQHRVDRLQHARAGGGVDHRAGRLTRN
jgi:hypothetical protein